jgi:hypothetical protein
MIYSKLKKIAKVTMAGMTALVALNIFCLVYYNIPVHITTTTGVTDYTWEPYAYYSKMTEGFAFGKMNNEGFNNLEDYNKQPVKVLLMGSSQMEATNVAQSETTASVLNDLFYNSKYVYNIGISGHFFLRIVNNLETAIEYYMPEEYVIIETSKTQFDQQSLEEAIQSRMQRIPSFDSKIMFFLQRIPYLRLIHFQYKNYIRDYNIEDENITEQVVNIADTDLYSDRINQVMKKLKLLSDNYKVKIIIFYHQGILFDNDDNGYTNIDLKTFKIFKDACHDNGIYFVDMPNIFLEEYKKTHTLPYGFANTALGSGHLNKNGHRLIANALFQKINEINKNGSSI